MSKWRLSLARTIQLIGIAPDGGLGDIDVVTADFARELERELAEAHREIQRICQMQMDADNERNKAPRIIDIKVIDSFDLFQATELEIEICRMPSGEEVIRFVDCTGEPPIIYKWCFEAAVKWVREHT